VQARRTFIPEPPQPLVDGAHAHSCGVRRLFHPQAVLKHPLNKKGSTARRKTGMFMQVHPGLLEGWLIRTSSLPGSPRMNNLLRDHS
jgi:hypothetical protein